ncbi:phospholipid-translocating P-type ATPase [Tilletiaria anomala UBC 951]|uniref:P-type phospholipid transporter n=1 Tax=Tilletiaria anomala (strain ATCC 24038 / CBS 436.72 / UBC 951) TaxID=1037660 RepID=A0A066VEC8_TILAU|nr:phospholipid-translocating P-type ATPase [Tilletiaria anomala UBC 951]KDN37119.1 phospholipid-translocating P-type ATPase [Tilletiaria anomala UBC 951]
MAAYSNDAGYIAQGPRYQFADERGLEGQDACAHRQRTTYDVEQACSYYSQPQDSFLSDPSHPQYAPALDPQRQLRSVRTAAESIAESHRSEARRDARRKKMSRHKKGESIIARLGRGMSLRRGMSTKKGSSHVAAGEKSAISNLIADEFGRDKMPVGAYGTGGDAIDVQYDSTPQHHMPNIPTADAREAAEEEAQAEAEDVSAGFSGGAGVADLKGKKKKPSERRQVFMNAPLPRSELKKSGDPKRTYPRNKVRTSKYTILTFLPRFLFEQFRRIANVYFLLLIILQVRQEFTAGATVPQIAMLPLVAILTITAIKDSIEDYRRHVLDNQVNNSAATRLGMWRNVNQPKDPRSLLQKMIGLKGGRSPNKASRGVKKLREKEDAIGMRSVTSGRSQAAHHQQQARGQTQVRPSTGRSRTDSLTSGGFALEAMTSESERPESEWHSTAFSMGRSGSTRNLLAPVSSYTNSNAPSLTHVPSNGDKSFAPSVSQGVVDYSRHVPGTARWERTLWKKLEVGDIVLLREDDQVPADIVVLSTSDADGNAYIETKNLDGETNLKVRKALKATSAILSEEDAEHARFVIDSEPPHANLYAYNGLLKYSVRDSSDPYDYDKEAPPDSSAAAAQSKQTSKVEPVTINELLLRGCFLRNTEWIIGIVLFTGEDTKIMLNGGDTPSKRSKIEKETNFNVLMNFVLLFGMCLACAIVGGFNLNRTDTSRYYYEQNSLYSSSTVVNGIIIFFSCMVVFQNIVPISLYISIEIVKTIQAFFIYQDVDMYYEPLDYPCVPKTWNISDDLGQIEYIFSDKTGTLTQNVMEFKKCSINGVAYGEGITEAMIGAMRREGKDTSGMDADTQERQLEQSKAAMINTITRAFKNRYLREDKMTLISPPLAQDICTSTPEGAGQRKNIIAFFRALALCHTALADRQDANDPFTVDYKAQSPDESALVAAARDVGAVFLNKNNQTIDIEVMGHPERFIPLKVLEFNSTRKRMSVIVREPEGRILLITKGADSVIFERLRADHPAELKQKTHQDLEDFANAGLRTLCISYRYLDEGEYLEWSKIHDEAAAALQDRDELVDEAAEKIEVNLTLIGATALEDKLQVGVPEAIEKLHRAGIKLWILTGDKLQTAIEIGFSCNLLTSEMEIMIISSDHAEGTRAQIEAACHKIASAGRPVIINGKECRTFLRAPDSQISAMGKGGFAVVIDGETLKWALSSDLKALFLGLTTQCEAVVCCRVSPAQKALTVKLVKDGMNAMTLAIGDGANDVAMIQEAHCGVGIAGLEGAQASMSADYAIGQFRFLTKLLLVHGHWSVVRIARMHVVFFMKNLVWTGTLFWFQIHNQFDATLMISSALLGRHLTCSTPCLTDILLFNLVFTSLPVIILGALDQDVNAKALLAVPETYRKGITGEYYTRSIFFLAVIDAIYQSAVCYFIPWIMWSLFPGTSWNGLDMTTLLLFGTTVGAAAVFCCNLVAALSQSYWTVIFWIITGLSMVSYLIWAAIYSALPFSFRNIAFELFSTLLFWLTILLVVVVAMLPRYVCQAWQSCFAPSDCDVVREAWIAGDLKDRLGVPRTKSRPPNTKTLKNMEEYNPTDVHALPQRRSRESSANNSADPLTTDPDAKQGPFADQASQHREPQWHVEQPQGQGKQNRLSLQPLQMQRSGTAFSFYDPELLSSMSPQSPERHQGWTQQQGKGPFVPQINVQRGSASNSFTSKDPHAKQDVYSPYGVYAGGASSHTALNQSTDSFEQHFEQAFGAQQQRQWQEPTRGQPVAAIYNPASRFHDRFRNGPSSPQASPLRLQDDAFEQLTPTQAHPSLHPRDQSGMTNQSYHTADGDGDYR